MQTADPGPEITDRIIRCGLKVHRALGPGLLEKVYHQCLCWELREAGIPFEAEVPLAVVYEGVQLNCGYVADLIVARTVLVEVKSVERVLPVHRAQTLTYVRLSSCPVGLLMNFNVVLLKDGLHRLIFRGDGRSGWW